MDIGNEDRTGNHHRPLTNSLRNDKSSLRPLSDADTRLQKSTASPDPSWNPRHSNKTVQSNVYGVEPTVAGREKVLIGLLVAVATVVRLWKIWLPTSVVYVLVRIWVRATVLLMSILS